MATMTTEEREAKRAQKISEALHEGIVAERLYEPYVAAALIGIVSERAEKTLADIPAELLPVHWVGPNKGLKRYYGRNLILYIRTCGEVLEDEKPLRIAS